MFWTTAAFALDAWPQNADHLQNIKLQQQLHCHSINNIPGNFLAGCR
jgi:hypothetical protein